jgi:integrase/recombinase XerC
MQSTQSPTWTELMVPYLTHLRGKRRSPRTMELREYQIGRFFRSTGLQPADVTIEDLRAWMDNPAWAPNTAQVVKSSLGSYFGYLHDEEILPTNPAKRLESPKVPSSKPKPGSDEAVANALASATARVRLMISLGALAGLRAMEIAAIHTRDVEVSEHGATLRILGKGAKTRIVPIADELAMQLMSDEPGFLFPGRIGGHISAAYVSRLVSQTLPPGVTCHKLRHRFATRAYRNSNHNLRAVQLLLGHSSVATTEMYTAIDGEELRQAALSAA